MSFAIRNCPVCDTPNNLASHVISSSPKAEDLSFEELKENFCGFKKKSCFFSYFRCSHCKVLYCPIYFSSEQLRALYSHMSDNSAGEISSALLKTQNSYIQKLSKFITIEGDWLEIGGDVGLMAKQLLEHSNVQSLDVIEPNLDIHDRLNKVIKTRGIIATSWSEIESKKKFNGIVAVHVLDHLLDLDTEIKKIIRVLKPHSAVFFITHNENSILQNLLKRKWPPYCLQHPQLFNPDSLNYLLRKNGFDHIKVSRTSNFLSFKHIIEVATSVLGIGHFLVSLAPHFVFRVKLGNIAVCAMFSESRNP